MVFQSLHCRAISSRFEYYNDEDRLFNVKNNNADTGKIIKYASDGR